ncbi:hypothetical protein JZO73_03145 [Enterococcus plantarum]|uniref:DUF5067 domain-containing protein n=1 Tax=Enterococcus plantarum TaxID=1077675 RepID=UPI001A8F6D83|nr:DUF5067 domain-containing protein [Enterococcus plantarum]MBO0466524.1 hypothetical protein [Enterococcus plantarum]
MKNNKKILISGIVLIMLFLVVGCNSNKLSDETTKVEGKGATYSFRLPSSWKKQADFKSLYGTQAVYGAEDTVSNSNMAVVIVSKDDIKKDGFGEKTRKDLATQNGYQDEKDVYFVQKEINGNDVFKYSFETIFNSKQVWAHYYSIFTEHAVIQFLYYSAQDSSYEDRVKIIDESIETVKEVSYSAEKAEEEAKKSKKDEVSFSTDEYEVNIIGLGTLKNDGDELVALRFSYKNKTPEAQLANVWVKDIELNQAGKVLTETILPKDSVNYDIVRLQDSTESSVPKGETKEGVLLYKVNGQATISLTLAEGIQSEQNEYALKLPQK